MKAKTSLISLGGAILLLVLPIAATFAAGSVDPKNPVQQQQQRSHPSIHQHGKRQSGQSSNGVEPQDSQDVAFGTSPKAVSVSPSSSSSGPSETVNVGIITDTTATDLHKMIAVDYRPPTEDHTYGGSLRAEYAHHLQHEVEAMDILEVDDKVIAQGKVHVGKGNNGHGNHGNRQGDPYLTGHGRTNVNGPGRHHGQQASPCLLFSDDFDKLDNAVWRHDLTLTGGGNFEVQAYINNRTNTFVKDGIFYIRPTLTEYRIGADAVKQGGVLDMWGMDPGTQCTGNFDYGCFRVAGAGGNYLNPIQSGLVRSVNSFKFRYGKVQVRAKMPKGKWIWPAIWMLPVHYQYGNWPASGEIDLVESRGNGPEYEAGGHDKVSSTLHWGPSFEFNRYTLTHAEYTLPGGKTFADDFHVFTLDWRPDGLTTYVDDQPLLNVTFDNMFQKGHFPSWVDNLWAGSNAAPFDQEFYLIMNVAVAGTSGYFPDNVGNKPWSDKSGHAVNEFYDAKGDWYPTWGPENGLDRALAIDYVRVFKYDCQ
ncbi:hypothetical protein BGX28_005956 [Mortierella sp. GBA30]|nr:hypothetical protein BGX28_005956 [Mortierella sp. GBA30]